MAIGFTVLFIAGLCQGSFGCGYKNHKPFSWSVFWGVYNILCIVVSISFVLILSPELLKLAFSTDSLKSVLCGAIWGASAICFSKSIDSIGMSLVYGISMGISTLSGSITPMIMNSSYPKGKSAILFIASLILTILGVAVITVAGVRRDGKTKSSILGIVFAVFSGLGSGIMNLGFSFSSNIYKGNDFSTYSGFALSTAKWLPVLVGGCIAGLIYCIGETTALKQWKTATEKGSFSCTLRLFATSIVWYLALILYGVSTNLIGDNGSTVGWILFNSFALIVSIFWGLKTGEWKGKKKGILCAGCVILIISWAFTYFVFI